MPSDAAEPVISIIPSESDAESSTTLDIAVALASGEIDVVEQVSLNEAEQPTDQAESAVVPAPDEVTAEEVPAEEPTSDSADAETAPAEPDVPRRFRPITELTVNVAPPGGLLPEQADLDRELHDVGVTPEIGDLRLMGGWGDSVYEWSSTRLCHGPLYFEEVNLERYGYQCSPAVQPLVSGAHFFLTVPTLPYQMTVHPPRECIYTLGHYRPGSRVPWQRSRLPWDPRAAAVEAGVVVGLVFLIP